ncbi:MAG TPA: molybdopterin-dependent oxidoreductase [Bradyrhizobium sp.]|uniref:molybdopterin-containing oxidoreductase family protein n=1 Tax=Bradyrhizobium sp. TaxID=376 RepID=UPI002D0BAF7C|nr:molybdopterin-dependent oxidoreductase [Bradyrhizobium sp.]HLZ02785.1 molybdopterin-dependent oxidoreductase [Bradyrhizobium sp.]
MTTAGPKIVRTMCPMNCHPTYCGMLVEVEGGRLKTLSGDKDNPDSRGFLCVRGRATGEIFGNPKRLLYPQIRDDRRTDAWRRVSWDEALEFMAKRIRTAGPEAVGLWAGHGGFTTGSAITVQLMQRFANMYGCQNWHPAMICWGLGGFGAGLSGALKVNTKEDMAENSNMIVLWGANIASQPNTARHVVAARRRRAKIVTIDVRRTEAAAQSDEVLLIRPGSDAALALAVMHVIITEKLHDPAFVGAHTVGFEELSSHILPFTPAWAAAETGLEESQIASFARSYASTRPAMILFGGSSMHKGANGWHAARAISCLPALTGDFGIPGGGLGPRHGAHSVSLGHLNAGVTRAPGNTIPNQMPEIAKALSDRRLKVLLLLGTNMLSSFADAAEISRGLEKTEMVVCVDLFMNETARRFADVVLPGTAWLEELGFKFTNTHLYLMERALEREGETRPIHEILKSLANSLGLADFFPWASTEEMIDVILNDPTTGHATVASLRAAGGFVPLKVRAVAYADRKFDSPSGKIEFHSSQAASLGLPPLPVHEGNESSRYPLALSFGRTLTHFHAFYDEGKALSSLAKHNTAPQLWISPVDAQARRLADGDAIRIYNDRGEFAATACITRDVRPGVVWIRDGWVGLNNLTSGEMVLSGDALSLFPFSVGQAAYGAQVEVARAARL